MKKLQAFIDDAKPQQPSHPTPQHVLLYVEDDDTNWEVTLLRLKNRYRLYRARNAEEACEFVRSLGDTLSAVLMDIQLQGSDLDGVQLTRLLKGTLQPSSVPIYARGMKVLAAPIVFVTANAERHGVEALKKAGGSLVVSKPIDFLQFTIALNGLLLGQRVLSSARG